MVNCGYHGRICPKELVKIICGNENNFAYYYLVLYHNVLHWPWLKKQQTGAAHNYYQMLDLFLNNLQIAKENLSNEMDIRLIARQVVLSKIRKLQLRVSVFYNCNSQKQTIANSMPTEWTTAKCIKLKILNAPESYSCNFTLTNFGTGYKTLRFPVRSLSIIISICFE